MAVLLPRAGQADSIWFVDRPARAPAGRSRARPARVGLCVTGGLAPWPLKGWRGGGKGLEREGGALSRAATRAKRSREEKERRKEKGRERRGKVLFTLKYFFFSFVLFALEKKNCSLFWKMLVG